MNSNAVVKAEGAGMSGGDEMDPRQESELLQALEKADTLLSRSYLNEIGTAEVVPLKDSDAAGFDVATLNKSVRFFDVTQIVLDNTENTRDKLVSVFNAVGSAGAGLLMLIHGTKDHVSIKFGIKSSNSDSTGKCGAILQNALSGNFPGTTISPVRSDGLSSAITETFGDGRCALVSVTDVAGTRSEQENRDRLFMQGIEKVVDAMRGREYSLLLVADSVGMSDLAASRRALESLYSCLVPFSGSQISLGANESETVGKSISRSVTETISHSVGTSVTHTTGRSTSRSGSTSRNVNINPGAIGSAVGATIGFFAGGPGGAALGGMIGGAIGGSVSVGRGRSKSITEGETESDGKTDNVNDVKGKAEGVVNADSSNETKGESRSLMLKFENRAVKGLLKKIDKTLERYDVCADLGMWNSAVYVLSPNPTDAEMAASVYHSVIRGKNSALETGRVAVWNEQVSVAALEYLRRMEHPLVNISGTPITPGTLVSSSELAISAGLPCRSLPGLPVLECARFGRTVASYASDEWSPTNAYAVGLGKVWNMNHEEDLPVKLNPDSLTAHAFVTGSTGSGKSNTIYRMLSEVRSQGATFLVVEPAKGEYKNVLGRTSGVSVFGTNPKLSELLRINPFSVPSGIHVLEHLDRLVDIFNVCWPMYAAMPAVLKDAIEMAYRECGWDLTASVNKFGDGLYPTFADVARCVKVVIDSSEYDAENKGAYKGSLLTRLTSLTNGINSLVFRADELSNNALFDNNVIVDLSRIGSTETKALIMGVLVLKLQEYRMTGGLMNATLRHVTVLEEAHNLLRRTSGSSQGGESGGGASLLAKSVEMLSNAIAELRTYGEGFIIADQSPGLLDMSVIRNTNTKIVMRLPDQGDRELVGRAMHLNDAQISELARLPRGVAAIYQNEWVESVLCKVEKHLIGEGQEDDAPTPVQGPASDVKIDPSGFSDTVAVAIADHILRETPLPSAVARDLSEGRIPLSARSRVIVARVDSGEIKPPKFTLTGVVVSELFPNAVSALRSSVKRTSDQGMWTSEVIDALPNVEKQLQRDIVQAIMTETLLHEMNKRNEFNAWYEGGHLP